ncbi:mannose-6-phosphate isomerase, class I [Microbacterium sp. NPDC089189]|uniref:mannose-6-phosphate isomerase, class I n=1 Tax=Microbacterium sp. NPDC089189 TaxID=3154972 RepID=UPI0034266EC5
MLAPLTNTPRDYAWGSSTLIAELEGRVPSGRPEAEVWFGDHPGSPALLQDGSSRTLDAWFAAEGVATDSPERLPYLLKLLAAGSPLSIQVHPSQEQARAGAAREDAAGIAVDAPHRNYRDDNHKPEVIVAVSDTFEALAGLRPLARTRVLLDALGDAPGVARLREVLGATDDAAALRDALAWLLSGTAGPAVAEIIAAVRAATSETFATEIAAIGRIADAYPGDPGVVVALLMNHVTLRRGEAVYVPAGVLHAYLSGLGVELMAASDNVLRGGLTPKHIDVDELLAIVDTRPGEPPLLPAVAGEPGVDVFAPGIEDFELLRVVVAEGEVRRIRLRGPAIALATAGAPVVTAPGGRVELVPGGAAFASPDERTLEITGAGELYLAMPGRVPRRPAAG